MTPDELRALAGKFRKLQAGEAYEAADYLRACADAEPVARIYTDAEMVHRDERWGRVQWIEPESELAEGTLLYTHPAPAAPHYAMLDSHRRLVERAIEDAARPSGMSTHDGKAHIDASVLRRMLSIIDSSPAVPAGWKLVPVEPTQAMNNAGLSAVNQYGKRLVWETYKAMLAAAPQAEPKRTGEVK